MRVRLRYLSDKRYTIECLCKIHWAHGKVGHPSVYSRFELACVQYKFYGGNRPARHRSTFSVSVLLQTVPYLYLYSVANSPTQGRITGMHNISQVNALVQSTADFIHT